MITPRTRVVPLLTPLLGLAMASTVPCAPGASAATTVPLTDCASSDNGKPVVSSFQLGAHNADVRTGEARIPVTAVVDDTGGPGPATGVERVLVVLRTAENRDTSRIPQLLARSGDGRTWQGTLTLPPGVVSGTWSAELIVVDGAYAEVDLGPDDLRAIGSDPDVTVQSSGIDAKAPDLRALTVSRKKVDTRNASRRVVVTVRAADATSGLGRVVVRAGAKNGLREAKAALRLVAGTRTSGTWRGSLVIPRWAGTTSPWRLSARLVDRRNNTTKISTSQLARRDQASAITVRSRSDRTRPSFSDIRISPRTIDVRNDDGVLRVSARVSDTGSGIVSGGVTVGNVKLHRVSGSRYAGRYTGELVVDRCSTDFELRPHSGPESLRFYLHAHDRAGHDRGSGSQPRPPVSALFRDNDWPGANAGLRLSGQVEISFQEDVVANGTWNPRLAPQRGGAEVAGTWSCADASGRTVGCDLDPFRSASFTPAQPLAQDTAYEVTVNREHTLRVVDLAGNPVVNPALVTVLDR